jgi:glyoxylase-like metal-dependent hydrolase (beta-lactamase superfamily II)
VKICAQIDGNGQKTSVLVINDTGVGTNVSRNPPGQAWNIANFIGQNFNPGGDIPYLVILSHCHYDHILGIEPLLGLNSDVHDLPTHGQHEVTILSSSHARTFATPYEVLVEHSLCASEGLRAPVYQTSIWAEDIETIIYRHPSGSSIHLPIITLHTPGHTPDSLSWYDTEERVLYVGDSFYEQESNDTREAPWGPESPASILFPNEGNLLNWWRSLDKLVAFVDARNEEQGARVTLAAGHVTAGVDAQEFLRDVRRSMATILRDEADFQEQPMKRGEHFGHWTIKKQVDAASGFSLGAPLRIIQEGRNAIPKGEWGRNLMSN